MSGYHDLRGNSKAKISTYRIKKRELQKVWGVMVTEVLIRVVCIQVGEARVMVNVR